MPPNILIQRNFDLTKCQGTGELSSLYRGFVISRVRDIEVLWRTFYCNFSRAETEVSFVKTKEFVI